MRLVGGHHGNVMSFLIVSRSVSNEHSSTGILDDTAFTLYCIILYALKGEESIHGLKSDQRKKWRQLQQRRRDNIPKQLRRL